MATQNICVGAPSHESVIWPNINWEKCHREVRKLQVRIAKATWEGKVLTVDPDSLVQWQSISCQTSY